MKKKTLALLAFALALTSVSFAQGFHLGVKGGANIFKVDGKSFSEEYKFGYHLGAFAEININEKWGIQPELLWSQTNYRTGNKFSDLYPEGQNDVKGKLNYVSIPILLSFRPVKLISFQVGPQFGIMTSQDKDLLGETKEAFKSGDFSMLGGAQLNLGALRVGGRYVVGLTNINDIDNKDKWKNQGFQLYLGFAIL
ncbi:porin family protein [Paraflavitalea sp. CAU 1676]|uniref:porin family protein n=1 Tax=Paraflavitalea sp. CAU 1676 TaxID=3032598 RepID=UPI0023DAD233|nr:porin family protein [Paraflavitalea sp. CAU 1676]MDF2189509.1 porin family protein [Paraflavitalea sp. CAU 1676]